MATVQQPADNRCEERYVIHGVSWATYEALLKDLADARVPRVSYDRGMLELMSPSPGHESLNVLLSRLVGALTEELNIEIVSLGSTTWRRRDLLKGLEADSCYFITNEPLVHGRDDLDLNVDPPPDLAIEVEVSHGPVDKMSIYAALGVPEVWRVTEHAVRVFQLNQDGQYVETESSAYFPAVAMIGIRQFLTQRQIQNETTWIKAFRRWVRDNLVK